LTCHSAHATHCEKVTENKRGGRKNKTNNQLEDNRCNKKQRPQVFTINQTNIEAFEALSGLKNNCLKGCQRKCQSKQEKIYAIAPETNAIKSRPIKTAQNTLA